MVGWFLTPSEVKRAAVLPMARVGGLMVLLLAAAAATTASAEPMRDRDREGVARELEVRVTGRIKASCQLSGGGELNMGELHGGERATALFGLDCNVPFDLALRSQRGGLAHVSQPQGEGPFAGTLPYDVLLTVPTLRPDPVVVQASFKSTQMAGQLSSGEGISAGGGKLEFKMRDAPGSGLLAGQYTETLTLTVTPRA
jgi:hypothetical protein